MSSSIKEKNVVVSAASATSSRRCSAPRFSPPLSRWLLRSARTIFVCLTILLGADAIGPLHAQNQVSTFPAGAEARAAIYRPLLDPGTGTAPRAALDQVVKAAGRNPVVLAAGGVLGGAVGLMAGGFVGGLIGSTACDYALWGGGDSCYGELFTAMTLGAVLGEATLMPLGVHLADRRRGNYSLMTLASVGIAAGGLGLVATAGRGSGIEGPILISTALTQLVASIVIEGWTAGR